MSVDHTRYPEWPWREVTTWMDEIEGLIKFKLLFRDADGNLMVDRIWFTSNYDHGRVVEVLSKRAAVLEAEGATFPVDATWV